MEEATQAEGYYGPDAYNSTKTEGVKVTNNSRFSATTRKVRSNPLDRFASAQCQEFFANDVVGMIELIRDPDDQAKKDIASPGHEIQYWTTFSNPRAVIKTITGVLQILTITTWIGGSILSALVLIYSPEYLLKCLIVTITPNLLYLLGKYILRKELIIDKNNIYLHRRNGTVEIPRRKQPPAILPFEEFDAYLTTSVNPSGSTSYHLSLEHRYSELRASYPAERSDPWKINLLWEYWQQYMDVSQPLPDTPKMEPFRSRDPVTAEHDKKVGRPPDFWKNVDEDTADEWYWTSVAAAKKYPWGLPRDEAIAHGWQPSPYNEENLKSLYTNSLK